VRVPLRETSSPSSWHSLGLLQSLPRRRRCASTTRRSTVSVDSEALADEVAAAANSEALTGVYGAAAVDTSVSGASVVDSSASTNEESFSSSQL